MTATTSSSDMTDAIRVNLNAGGQLVTWKFDDTHYYAFVLGTDGKLVDFSDDTDDIVVAPADGHVVVIEEVEEAVSKAQEQVEELVSEAQEQAEEIASALQEEAEEAVSAIQEEAEELLSEAEEELSELSSEAEELLTELESLLDELFGK